MLKEDMNHLCKDIDTLYSRRVVAYDHAAFSLYGVGGLLSRGSSDAFKTSSNNSVNTTGGLPSPTWDFGSTTISRRVLSTTTNNNPTNNNNSKFDELFNHNQTNVAVAVSSSPGVSNNKKSHKCVQTTQTVGSSSLVMKKNNIYNSNIKNTRCLMCVHGRRGGVNNNHRRPQIRRLNNHTVTHRRNYLFYRRSIRPKRSNIVNSNNNNNLEDSFFEDDNDLELMPSFEF